jgi:8-oxo-dGTP diphosphatase
VGQPLDNNPVRAYCHDDMKMVRVELVVVSVQEGGTRALLARLPGSVWALPGRDVPPGVTLEAAARDALAEQAGVRDVALEQLYTFDRADGAAVTVAHLGLLDAGRHPLTPGPSVVEVRWFPTDDPPALGPEAAEVLAYGVARLRAKAAYAPIALQLLPETFTLGELQAAYEAVLGHELDTRNFRRDVMAPDGLYRSAPGDFQVLARERRIARAIAGPPRPG